MSQKANATNAVIQGDIFLPHYPFFVISLTHLFLSLFLFSLFSFSFIPSSPLLPLLFLHLPKYQFGSLLIFMFLAICLYFVSPH